MKRRRKNPNIVRKCSWCGLNIYITGKYICECCEQELKEQGYKNDYIKEIHERVKIEQKIERETQRKQERNAEYCNTAAEKLEDSRFLFKI